MMRRFLVLVLVSTWLLFRALPVAVLWSLLDDLVVTFLQMILVEFGCSVFQQAYLESFVEYTVQLSPWLLCTLLFG